MAGDKTLTREEFIDGMSRARADGEAVGLEPRLGEDSKLCVGKQASNLDHLTRQSVEDFKSRPYDQTERKRQ